MKTTLLLLCALLSCSTICGQVGCMDNSKHMDPKAGPDFKTYHYVYCTCPCQRYAHSNDRGRCEKCLHYRDQSIAYSPNYR